MMRRMLLWVANQVSRATPVTRGFGLRRRLFRAAGVSIHPSAKICGGVVFDNPYARIGANTWVGGGCRLIGAPGAAIQIAENCDLGPEVLLVTGTHEIGPAERRAGRGRCESIVIGAGVWVGARATLLAGVTVGRGSVIGAGSLVNSDVEPDSLAVGVPARSLPSLLVDGTSPESVAANLRRIDSSAQRGRVRPC